MHEELWQSLVAPALCRSMDLRPEGFHSEVPTRDGSRIDLLYTTRHKLIGFELKMGDPGEALRSLSARDLRQLRHFRAATHAVYLVTVACPRQYALTADGQTLRCEPLELQALPPGIGWVVFDRLSHDATVIAPAHEGDPKPEDRRFVVDHLLNRLSVASKHLKWHLGA